MGATTPKGGNKHSASIARFAESCRLSASLVQCSSLSRQPFARRGRRASSSMWSGSKLATAAIGATGLGTAAALLDAQRKTCLPHVHYQVGGAHRRSEATDCHWHLLLCRRSLTRCCSACRRARPRSVVLVCCPESCCRALQHPLQRGRCCRARSGGHLQCSGDSAGTQRRLKNAHQLR